MLALQGETAITIGVRIPKRAATLTCRALVAVAVKANMRTSSGMILRISPIRKRAGRNVSPLQEYITISNCTTVSVFVSHLSKKGMEITAARGGRKQKASCA